MKIKPMSSNFVILELENGLQLSLIDIDGELNISSDDEIKSQSIRKHIRISRIIKGDKNE